jgi:hypothetical protein
VGGGCAAELYSGKGDPGSLKNLFCFKKREARTKLRQAIIALSLLTSHDVILSVL